VLGEACASLGGAGEARARVGGWRAAPVWAVFFFSPDSLLSRSPAATPNGARGCGLDAAARGRGGGGGGLGTADSARRRDMALRTISVGLIQPRLSSQYFLISIGHELFNLWGVSWLMLVPQLLDR
jgi:hypothetical protein